MRFTRYWRANTPAPENANHGPRVICTKTFARVDAARRHALASCCRYGWNGEWFDEPDAGAMGFGFHELIAHVARTRRLHAGTIIGSGAISNAAYRSVGSGCIAERRGTELPDGGRARTSFMKFGDQVRIEMRDAQGGPLFSAIDQRMVQAPTP